MSTDANNAQINTGSVWAPYQEFFYTIPAGQYQRVNYVTDNFVLLETTANNALEVNFGGAMNQTNFTAGVQYKLESVVPYVQLYNKSASPVTVHFALGVGDVRDNRLSLVGPITTSETYTTLNVSRETFSSSGVITISAAARKIVLQNVGSATVYVGAANGFEISSGGSMDIPLDGSIDIYGTNGESVVVGLFS